MSSFAEVLSAMQTDKYWINFFVRPCCPPPGKSDALKALDKRRAEINDSTEFALDEKNQLLAIVDEREAWYLASPFCRNIEPSA